MSFTWALNSNNDIYISNGKIGNISNVDEVRQRILVTLRHNWQEYFLNVPGGVPWYELILGGKDRHLYEALLRKIILSVPNVLSILSFSSSFENRSWAISTVVEV